MSSPSAQKPPLLPSTFSPPHRQLPGPNAFALAAQAEEDEKRMQSRGFAPQKRYYVQDGGRWREEQVQDVAYQGQSHGQDSGHQRRPHTHDGSGTPLTASFDHDNGSRLPRSNSTARYRESTMTTFTNLMDQARGDMSPKKSQRKVDHSHVLAQASTDSRHGSTTRSKHSGRSNRSDLAALGEENRTLRGELESQKERKYFKMMGQVPDTPTLGTHAPDSMVSTSDLRLSRESKDLDAAKKPAREERAVKSPKKKIFGMSIPSFMTSNNAPAPVMPAKVAKVLGTSPPKRRFSPRGLKPSGSSLPLRSDTSTSLPNKLHNQYTHHNHNRRPNMPNPSSTSRSRVRAASRRSPPAKEAQSSRSKQAEDSFKSASGVAPPIPPEKDTPERVKNWLARGPPQEEEKAYTNSGMRLHLPTMQMLDPVPPRGGESPSKFCPYGAKDYVTLVDGDHIKSAYGVVEHTDTDQEEEDSELLEENHSVSLDGQHEMLEPLLARRPDGWSRDGHDVAPQPQVSAQGQEQLEYLPATVYSPPAAQKAGRVGNGSPSKKTDEDRLSFAIPPKTSRTPEKHSQGSIGVIFQGEANEIDPASSTRRMLQSGTERASSPQKTGNENGVPGLAPRILEGTLQVGGQNPFVNNGTRPGGIRQSASQLTDMLSGVSPSKTGFGDFQPNCPSAVPSPLHRVPGQPPPMPPSRSGLPASVPNMNMNDHFYVTNEHIDVVACSLYDHIAMWTKREMGASSSKHDQLLSVVGQRFEDIKSQISSISEKADHSATQNHNLSLQLDKLLEFIKKEIVVPMEAQTNKMMGMEQSIKELQKTMHDLQKSAERNNAPAGYPITQSGPPTFPLPNHRSQPSLAGYYDESGREPMPHQQQMPGYVEARRYGNNYFNRSGYSGREGKDTSHPFSSTNPYNINLGQVSGGFVQAFQPSDPQHYGFNQGPSQ